MWRPWMLHVGALLGLARHLIVRQRGEGLRTSGTTSVLDVSFSLDALAAATACTACAAGFYYGTTGV
jgi:hypothetical protein